MQINKIEDYTLPEGRSLGLKVVFHNGRPEYPFPPKGFRWNLIPGGETVAPDWDSTPEVGGGLHVWEWACGNLGVSDIWDAPRVIWMAVEYETSKAVDLDGLVKVPKGKTIAISSNRKEVIAFVQSHNPTPEGLRDPILFEEKTAEEGDVKVGDGGCAITKGGGTARTGIGGTAIAGDGGNAITGDWGVTIVGVGGTAIAGYGGTATAGYGGTAIAGYGGKAKAGKGGKLVFANRDGGVKVFFVGENGIKPDTFYGHSDCDSQDLAEWK